LFSHVLGSGFGGPLRRAWMSCRMTTTF
jgi:hypothetical protein